MRYLYNSGNRYGTVVTNNNVHRVITEYPREVFYFNDEELYQYMSYNDLGFNAIDFNDMTMLELETLLMWCKQLEPIKSVNENYSSYNLKHMFEREPYGFYISNGNMKEVMALAGFKPKNADDLNWFYPISERSIKQL
ncbi:hypothetical protein ACUXQE_001948 [Staphylococcus saprophyticus]|uniref:hypothetical protein n=1 Tax=Staphylococcus TaxID=1279 RepID=UPI000928B91F|nr:MULTISPECIES: hypothetical protein [Staphylococcus]MDH9184697.1 hypothetical protein [Staphylococcus epidermidis]SIN58999.1 Uncharacterised protein [Mycobacteroides abscessus subsp. abscessus]MCC3737775.1 hypothetical protein [Staphylococcus hominis]MCM3121108.1 hypothetical protein [Staphylococcus saprophyticus]MDS3882762.1 hypothetical protein [Staphylococcus hominis]